MDLQAALETLKLCDANPTERLLNGMFKVWLGAGITPRNTEELLTLLVRRLRDLGEQHDQAREALGELTRIANVDDLDLAADELDDARLADAVARMARDYSRAMSAVDMRVVAKPAAMSLALDVLEIPDRYTQMPPAAVHRLLCLLVAEGLLDEVISTNWDDCVEKAWAELAPAGLDLPSVVVEADLLDATRPRLVKVHGCARMAREAGPPYSEAIAVTKQHIRQKCVDGGSRLSAALAAALDQKSTIMVGMSAQDEDIQQEFLKGSLERLMPKPALAELLCRPRVMFTAKDGLGETQDELLRSLYGEEAWSEARGKIRAAAAIPLWGDEFFGSVYFDAVLHKLRSVLGLSVGTDLAEEQAGFCNDQLDQWVTVVEDYCRDPEAWDNLVVVARRVSAVYGLYVTHSMESGYRPIVPGALANIDPAIVSERGVHRFILAMCALLRVGGLGGRSLDWAEAAGSSFTVVRNGFRRNVLVLRQGAYGKAHLLKAGYEPDPADLLVFLEGLEPVVVVQATPGGGLPGLSDELDELYLYEFLTPSSTSGDLCTVVDARM